MKSKGNEKSLTFCNKEDTNGDGLLDLVCHVDTQKTDFQSNDTEGLLRGSTISEVPIEGSDAIHIIH